MTAPLLEKYYSVSQLAHAFVYSPKTIRRKIEAKQFGDEVLKIDALDWRVPASGVEYFKKNHLAFTPEPTDLTPIAARSEGELRRKIAKGEKQ